MIIYIPVNGWRDFVVGYIDVGGGLRGVYGAGVLDRILDDNIKFSCYIGVSAGSANIVSHLGGHRERTLRFYRDYSYHRDYMGWNNMIKKGSYINLDYIYSTLTDEGGLDPLNYDVFKENNVDFYVVATDSTTGEACYFDRNHIKRNDCSAIKASCSVPLACPPRNYNGTSYFDGGVSDPIPVRKALELGCDKIVVTLTLPTDFQKNHKFPRWLYPIIIKKYPKIAPMLYDMIDKYNSDLKYLRLLEKQGKALILSPDDCCGVTMLKRSKEGIQKLYQKGYDDACKVKDFLAFQENVSGK